MSSCGATNANVRARLAEVERERDAMRAVLSDLVWRHDNPSESFEDLAAAFRAHTGFMAPGKSLAPEMHDDAREEERQDSWRRWLEARREQTIAEWRALLGGEEPRMREAREVTPGAGT